MGSWNARCLAQRRKGAEKRRRREKRKLIPERPASTAASSKSKSVSKSNRIESNRIESNGIEWNRNLASLAHRPGSLPRSSAACLRRRRRRSALGTLERPPLLPRRSVGASRRSRCPCSPLERGSQSPLTLNRPKPSPSFRACTPVGRIGDKSPVIRDGAVGPGIASYAF
jgi:hypothetical protein